MNITTDTYTVVRSGVEAPRSVRWLVLTHRIPPQPSYFRVRIRRRLERLGAIALKGSVYALPMSDETLEDFHWLRQEIERDGGEATLSDTIFIDGSTDALLVARSREAREADYDELIRSIRALLEDSASDATSGLGARVGKLVRRLDEVVAIDFFGAPGREAAEQAIREVQASVAGTELPTPTAPADADALTPGRTWVTRSGVKVDRIASAWLIRRFIDAEARFAFVDAKAHVPAEGELRFDMFEGEYTHVGDACTFETLLARFRLGDPALGALAEIVHDIDCKDEKFGRPQTPGVAALIDGIVRVHDDDASRLERGAEVLDELYGHFSAPTQ